MTSCPLGYKSVACSAGLAISPSPLSVVPLPDVKMVNVCAAVGGMLSRLTATLPASAAVPETTILSDVPATASTSTAKTPPALREVAGDCRSLDGTAPAR